MHQLVYEPDQAMQNMLNRFIQEYVFSEEEDGELFLFLFSEHAYSIYLLYILKFILILICIIVENNIFFYMRDSKTKN